MEEDPYLDVLRQLAASVGSAVTAISELRLATQLIVRAIARQPGLDAQKLLKDVSSLVEDHYPQDVPPPEAVTVLISQIHQAIAESRGTSG